MNGLGEVGHLEVAGAFEIGDGAGNFENAIVGTGCEPLLLHSALEQTFGIGTQFAVGADLARGHLRVGIDFFAGFLESLSLSIAGSHDTGADLG